MVFPTIYGSEIEKIFFLFKNVPCKDSANEFPLSHDDIPTKTNNEKRNAIGYHITLLLNFNIMFPM